MPGALVCLIGNYNIRERTAGRFETTHALIDAYRHDDREAAVYWLESVRALAFTISSLINVVDPEAVIIGGGIAQAGAALFEPLKRELQCIEWRPFGEPVKLLPAQLGEWAGAIGAARAAREALGN
jgi:glucokinase